VMTGFAPICAKAGSAKNNGKNRFIDAVYTSGHRRLDASATR